MTTHIELDGNTPLREQVYNYLKAGLNSGTLKAGAFLDLNAIGRELNLSRTPLRDALIRLEVEGFVVIHSRRGVMVKPIEISEIRDIYQIIGALEASAILEGANQIDDAMLERMRSLTATMKRNLEEDDFSSYYERNVEFHDTYLEKSTNNWLRSTIHRCKERLYDFPRRTMYLRGWEEASVLEHDRLIELLTEKNWRDAAEYIRDVHWSFSAQENFIKEYYFASLNE
ncbi:MAG: GntR family transcriptional regulator [Spirochaetes bacterium]|nr:GntR family transcriptional regulator [Spirochaetota bacterium]MBU0955600.1 GntR family transcriptional regulator [Spirochaetota bacterium]